MIRAWALVFSTVLSATLFAQEQSNEPDGSFEVEPAILPQNLKEDAALERAAAPAPVLDVAKLEKDLERARRNAAGAERLYKIGALAKIEAETRALKVVRLESDLENERLAQAKVQVLAQENGDASPAAVAKNDSSKEDLDLARAIEAAHAAAAKRSQAELEAAEINLRRQQKLLALGSGHKSDVARAEQKLAELKQPNP